MFAYSSKLVAWTRETGTDLLCNRRQMGGLDAACKSVGKVGITVLVPFSEYDNTEYHLEISSCKM
jgi:hypothetical protein